MLSASLFTAPIDLPLVLVYLVVLVVEIAAMWKVFTKADRPGWGAIIPIYNAYLLCKIAGRPGWWVVLFLIPLVNIVLLIVVYHDVSKAFGHGAGFTVGLVLLPFIFFPVLGFGSSQYRGGRGPGSVAAPATT